MGVPAPIEIRSLESALERVAEELKIEVALRKQPSPEL
jgi:hypothetical protein